MGTAASATMAPQGESIRTTAEAEFMDTASTSKPSSSTVAAAGMTSSTSLAAVPSTPLIESDEDPHEAGLSLLLEASLMQQQAAVPTTTAAIPSPKAARAAPPLLASHQQPSLASVAAFSSPKSRSFELVVLSGRGGAVNKNPGNMVYRRLVEYNKPRYRAVAKRHRILVAKSIVQAIVNQGGRFLQQESNQEWIQVDFSRAVQKTSQALRERTGKDAETEGGASATLEADGDKPPVDFIDIAL